MTTEEAIKILYKMEGKTAYSGELGGLAVNMAVEALRKQEEPVSDDLKETAIMHFKDVMEYEAKTGLKPAYMTSFKAGAKWQKERITEALLSEVLPCFMHGGEADEVVAKLDEVLTAKDK